MRACSLKYFYSNCTITNVRPAYEPPFGRRRRFIPFPWKDVLEMNDVSHSAKDVHQHLTLIW